jgi:hypothetical protein
LDIFIFTIQPFPYGSLFTKSGVAFRS